MSDFVVDFDLMGEPRVDEWLRERQRRGGRRKIKGEAVKLMTGKVKSWINQETKSGPLNRLNVVPSLFSDLMC